MAGTIDYSTLDTELITMAPFAVCGCKENDTQCIRLTLRWRHNGRDGITNHQPHHCSLNRLFGRRSKKTSKLCVTGHCSRNSPGTGEFPAQMASNAENVSIMVWQKLIHKISTDTALGMLFHSYKICKPITVYNFTQLTVYSYQRSDETYEVGFADSLEMRNNIKDVNPESER